MKRIFKFAAKCGAKLHTAKDLAARVNANVTMSVDDRKRLFRKPKLPAPVTAFDYELFNRENEYEWDKFPSIRPFHRWVYSGVSKLRDGVVLYTARVRVK